MFSEYIKSTVKGNTELDRESAHLFPPGKTLGIHVNSASFLFRTRGELAEFTWFVRWVAADVKTGAKDKGRRPTPFMDKEGSRVTEDARHVDCLFNTYIQLVYCLWLIQCIPEVVMEHL